METVLLILKIAGIIIAAVLGILIAGLFCVLFVPVRYRGDVSLTDGKEQGKRQADILFRATWLLHLVRVYVTYEETVRVRIKLLLFTLMDTAKEKKEQRRGRKMKKNRKEKNPEPQEEPAAGEGEIKEDREKFPAGDAGAYGSEKARKPKSALPSKEKRGIKRRISNILQTITEFCDKLKEIRGKTERIKTLWTSGHMARSRSLLRKELNYLLRHSRPGKLEGYLRFGFDDPSTTGYVLAAYYGILYPLWRPKISVEPDFENPVLESRVKIKGKVRAWHFLKSGCRLFFSRDIRRVVEDVRKL